MNASKFNIWRHSNLRSKFVNLLLAASFKLPACEKKKTSKLLVVRPACGTIKGEKQ